MLSLVESWQQSSMTQNEFARQNHITLSKFRYWVHKSRTLSPESVSAIPSSGFIRLTGSGPLPEGNNQEIRLRYPNGVWLSLPAGTPVSTLKNLIDF